MATARTLPTGRRRLEDWWRGGTGAFRRALDAAAAPAEWAYRGAAAARNRAYDTGWLGVHRVGVPVISVGNLAVGGTGKTPVVRWLVGELRRRGLAPAVVHGGFAPDEPELHRTWYPEVPVMVGRDRVGAARRGIAVGADVVILDDGFQHRRLWRDLDLVLVSAEDWSATPRLLPRGPWREAPSALRRAHLAAVVRKAVDAERARRVAAELRRLGVADRIVCMHLRPRGWRAASPRASGDAPAGAVVAASGIARPELFAANLAQSGVRLDTVLTFPDHHAYRPADLDRIRRVAAGRPVVTTEKDAIKLGTLAGDIELWVLEQELVLEQEAAAAHRLLDDVAARRRGGDPPGS